MASIDTIGMGWLAYRYIAHNSKVNSTSEWQYLHGLSSMDKIGIGMDPIDVGMLAYKFIANISRSTPLRIGNTISLLTFEGQLYFGVSISCRFSSMDHIGMGRLVLPLHWSHLIVNSTSKCQYLLGFLLWIKLAWEVWSTSS